MFTIPNKELLKKALTIDPEASPENRLVNALNQRNARWLLDHVEDFFLETGEDMTDIEEGWQ